MLFKFWGIAAVVRYCGGLSPAGGRATLADPVITWSTGLP